MRIQSIFAFAVLVGASICQSAHAGATVYNVDIFGPLPNGVSQGPSGSASTNACSATTCAGGFNAAVSFYAQPGDVINFGSLTLGSFIFGDGRQQHVTQYVDENGQLQFAFGTPTALYSGSLGVSNIYVPFIQLNYSPNASCNSGVPSCLPSLYAGISTYTVELQFTLTSSGFIELGWTSPYTYIPPTSIGAVVAEPVPEPSTWAMLLIGFAGVGLITYRRRSKAALIAA
jgi:hypothetical protein